MNAVTTVQLSTPGPDTKWRVVVTSSEGVQAVSYFNEFDYVVNAWGQAVADCASIAIEPYNPNRSETPELTTARLLMDALDNGSREINQTLSSYSVRLAARAYSNGKYDYPEQGDQYLHTLYGNVRFAINEIALRMLTTFINANNEQMKRLHDSLHALVDGENNGVPVGVITNESL